MLQREPANEVHAEPKEKQSTSLRTYSQKQAVADQGADKQSSVMSAAMLKLIAGAG